MAVSETEIIQELARAISSLVPAVFGDGYELAPGLPQRLDRRYSFMFRFWLTQPGGKKRPLLVKIPRESWMESMHEAVESVHIRDVIQNEFESMKLIATAISEAGIPELFAIRPSIVLPEFNALLLEEIPIRMLKTSLARPAIMLGSENEWQAFYHQLMLAGVWLNVIHNRFKSGQVATLQSLKMGEKVETELEILEKLTNKPLRSLRNLFRLLHDKLVAVEIPLTCLHHDYHLGNLFLTQDGRVGALDPNWVENGPLYHDLSTLLIYPVTYKTQILTQGLSFRPSLRKRYEQAVLQGYTGTTCDSESILDFYCALAVIVKWRMNEEQLKTGENKFLHNRSFFIAPLIRGYFQRVAQAYLSRGLKTAGL